MRDENQLHAAVVELVAHDDATIKYSTIQNWYPGDKDGKGGIYNFVTKRGIAQGRRSKITWTQVETGSAITWKLPGLHPAGRRLDRRVLLGGDDQQLAAGRHRHEDDPPREEHPQHDRLEGDLRRPRPEHLSRPRSGSARTRRTRATTRSATRCSSATSAARTRSRISKSATPRRKVEHEASTSKIGEDQIFYCRQRGIADRGRRQHDRQRLLQGSLPRAADGVRGRSAEAAERFSLEGSVG
mgnify:CR=1 FL=1